MKCPEVLINAKGTKTSAEVQIRGHDGKALREYGIISDGLNTSCLALTSPGDAIIIPFVLEPGVADFVDLVVDGIRRDCATSTGSDKTFARTFKRVCHQDRLKNGKRGGLKSCAMEIQSRNAENDMAWRGGGPPSAVGTLEVQLFKILDAARQTTDPNSQRNMPRDALDTRRAPTFAQCASWKEANPFIDLSRAPPSFEIGHQLDKFKVDRVLKEWPGQCKFIAGFKFKFCSTADLLARGYRDVPTYYISPKIVPGNNGQMSSRPDTLMAPSSNIYKEDSMNKTTSGDNFARFVEYPEAEVEYGPRIATGMQFEARGGFNPQHSTMNSVSQFPRDNRRQYLPNHIRAGTDDAEYELIPTVERAPYRPQYAYYNHSRPQTNFEDESAAHYPLLSRRDSRERIVQPLYYPGNLSRAASPLPPPAPRQSSSYWPSSPVLFQGMESNPYRGPEQISDSPTFVVRNQFSGFAPRQKIYEPSTNVRDPSEHSEVHNQGNGLSRVAETSCRKESLSASPQASPMSKNSAITEPHDGPMVALEKRKGDNINNDTPDMCKRSRREPISPAFRASPDSDEGLSEARTRLALAERRRAQLSEALEDAMHSKTVMRLNEIAEQIENENLDLEARLYSIEEGV